MLKLARDEITNMNKQHEIEINNLIDKNNLMRETNIERLKNDMRSPHGGREFMTHGEVDIFGYSANVNCQDKTKNSNNNNFIL